MFIDGRFDVHALSDDPNFIYVTSDFQTGRRALYKFDIAKGELADLIYAHEEVDVDGVVLDRSFGNPVAISYLKHNRRLLFLDTEMDNIFTDLTKAFTNPYSLISMSRDHKKAIILVGSSRAAGTYYYVDLVKLTIAKLFNQRTQRATSYSLGKIPIHYTARDAQELTGYLTYPSKFLHDTANLPLIVLPHDGRIERDYDRWDWQVQFLANLGYAVFQPNYRGSSGYGVEFIAKGMGEWADKIPKDIIDGVDHLIEEGIVDAERVCIMGDYFAGYQAIWGAIQYPETYRCAVSFGAITDLRAHLRDYDAFNTKSAMFQRILGAQKKRAARDMSPINHIKKLQAPVLITHLEDDRYVDFKRQAEHFFEEASDSGIDAQIYSIEESGRGINLRSNRIRWLRQVGSFLVKHNPPGKITPNADRATKPAEKIPAE